MDDLECGIESLGTAERSFEPEWKLLKTWNEDLKCGTSLERGAKPETGTEALKCGNGWPAEERNLKAERNQCRKTEASKKRNGSSTSGTEVLEK
ncbi:hypothetical protein AVEN_233751-1 [Araneus ventricosus]|uniref:Uncharacterized protein n=1 Tax=Araneus ventricosus TaxID=182803 RepID=A0A4Y2Q9D9_ARAVE|nr:hypothetical protein AVEN_233751-1 [Araneus ventricosus]